MTDEKILTTVGDKKRWVDFDLFLGCHAQLAEFYRALGLEGDKLDIAIVAEMPHRLAQVLDEQPHPTQH
jgi:hypothetical protein